MRNIGERKFPTEERRHAVVLPRMRVAGIGGWKFGIMLLGSP